MSATTNTTTERHLDHNQLARAEALREARQVLAERGPFSSSAADAMDLVNVASWILDGRDPWTTPAALAGVEQEGPDQ